MKKYGILAIIITMVVGFASVATSLSMNLSTSVALDPDFYNKVYFDNVTATEGTITLSDDKTSFTYTTNSISDVPIEFRIKNDSSQYDADAKVTCEINNEKIEITNNKTIYSVEALRTTKGKINVDPQIMYSDEDSDGTYSVGDTVTIQNESFNIVSSTEDTITMLAQYNLGTDYRQSEIENYVLFADEAGWEYTPGPKDIDIQTWSTNPKNYINNYVTYLKNLTGATTVAGDLPTLLDLKKLDCTINDDYSYNNTETCENSINGSWLINNQYWHTRSADPSINNAVWYALPNGDLFRFESLEALCGVRPFITISTDIFNDKSIFCTLEVTPQERNVEEIYAIGDEIKIDSETFNVISTTEETVTMLASYSLDSNYRQAVDTYSRHIFSNKNGWDLGADIDIQAYEGYVKTYVNEYVSYLQNETGDTSITGTLITLAQLEELGCNSSTCTISSYADWLGNGQYWWTRTAYPSSNYLVLCVISDGRIYGQPFYNVQQPFGIRPVITIKKTTLENL